MLTVNDDSRNLLHDQLRDGHYPLNIKFLMWQDSDLGKYIEFKIRVSYNEGDGSAHKSSSVSPTAAHKTSESLNSSSGN